MSSPTPSPQQPEGSNLPSVGCGTLLLGFVLMLGCGAWYSALKDSGNKEMQEALRTRDERQIHTTVGRLNQALLAPVLGFLCGGFVAFVGLIFLIVVVARNIG